MYYQAGDNYGRGDYYQGDPGIFGALKRIGGAVLRASPIGTAIRTAQAVGTALARRPQMLPQLPPPQFSVGVEQYRGAQLSFDPGRNPQSAGPVLGTIGPAAKCTTKGYHANKSSYYRRSPGGSVIYVEKGSACVKNRSMNPTNGKALRRGLRRAYAFKKIAMRTLRLLNPKAKKTFGGFKTAKKRSA